MRSTLVLNATFEPIHTSGFNKAILKIVNGKAVSMLDSDKLIHHGTGIIPIPYVIMLTKQAPYHAHKAPNRTKPFSLKGVLVRDNHTCAYCGKEGRTVDHVIPKKLGGKSTYENCVAACFKCNSAKGHKTLSEMGWVLPFTPGVPGPWSNGSPYMKLARQAPNKRVLELWMPFLEHFEPEIKTSLISA